MTVEEAIEVIETEIKCVSRQDCHHQCGSCELAMDQKDILDAYTMAITSLKKRNILNWISVKEATAEFPCIARDKFKQVFIPTGVLTVNGECYDAKGFHMNFEEFFKGELTGNGFRILPRQIIEWIPLSEEEEEKA